MSDPLLLTKLYFPPPRPKVVLRPRLIEQLNEGLHRKLILISAPAGFGKTTLVSKWITENDSKNAWLSLDEGDNDPNRFWFYLINACQTVRSEAGKSALELLKSPLPVPFNTVSSILINDLANLKSDLVVVLDDYHEIQNESIHTALSFLLEHLPENLHFVISTRIDPPWPFARFRARNQLVEIRARDLRFTTQESVAFLNQVMGLNLTETDVEALETRTEGWIAGLQLAALSLQGRDDISGFVKAFTGSHVYIAEYLIEEVFQRHSQEVQLFLLQTSILERLNAGLCETITGCKDGQSFLKTLYRANLFLVSLDDEESWFRYHHLFADLLQARLRQTQTEDKIRALHSRARQWYEQHGFMIEAVNHALLAQDFEAAANLIQQNANTLTIRGELTTLLKWIPALPGDVSRSHPQILISKAWTLTLAGDLSQVETLLLEIEAQIENSEDNSEVRELRGNVAVIRGYFAMLAGDYTRALELTNHAEELLPESSVQARSILPYTLGAAYRGQGEYEKAASAFAHLARIGDVSNELMVWVTGETEVVNTRHAQGRLRDACKTARDALRKMADKGVMPFGSLAKLEVAFCDVLREQNKLVEAHQRVTGVINRMKDWDMPTDRLFAYLTLTRILEAEGDYTGAFETLNMAKELRSAHPVLFALSRSVDIYEIRLLMATHDISAASRLMDDLQPGSSQMLNIRDQESIMLARIRFAQGRYQEVEAILAPLAQDAEISKRNAALLESLALQTCALDAQGQHKDAIQVLIKALTLAEPEGFMRVFLEEGEKMQSLLNSVARQPESAANPMLKPLKGFINTLLDSFPSNQITKEDPLSTTRLADLVEPLTPRELEVLQLIAAGHSNQTIAQNLVITVSAVKKHTGNIFGKLNVNSRTQAVARARQLGLLTADE